MVILNMEILSVLKYYFKLQNKRPDKVLSDIEKEEMVQTLKKIYDSLSNREKCDVLVPAKWDVVSDHAILFDMDDISGEERYDISYKWPPHDGFKNGECSRSLLLRGEEYDRIGANTGKYLAPITKDGRISTYLERAIPYYIPESDITQNPSYHRYTVIKNYGDENEPDSNAVFRGLVAQAFWTNPDDGGGEQVKLSKTIGELREVLN